MRENLAEDDNYQIIKSEPATDDDLLLICQKDYIDFTKEYYRAANLGLRLPGQFSRFHSVDNMPIGRPGRLEEAARLIVGQAKMACKLIQAGMLKKVISIGGGLHHAKPSYGEGFCLYNDVAFCALYLMQQQPAAGTIRHSDSLTSHIVFERKVSATYRTVHPTRSN